MPLLVYHVYPSDIMIEFNALQELIIDNFSEKVTEKEMNILRLLINDSNLTIKEKEITRIGSNHKGYWTVHKECM